MPRTAPLVRATIPSLPSWTLTSSPPSISSLGFSGIGACLVFWSSRPVSPTVFSRCWSRCSPDHKDVYSYNFPEDGRRLKLFGMQISHPLLSLNSSYIVYTVFLLETVQTALTGADVYHWFASGYGDLNRLATPFASAIDVPIMESIVSAMVQFFYAYRVWILSNKSWWFCSLICLVSRLQAPFNHSHQGPPSS
jgi:hypothetical protein